MKEKIQNREKCRGKANQSAFHCFGRGFEGQWLLAQRFWERGIRGYTRHGVSASPFNALFMALHSDRNGCNTNLFTLFSDAKPAARRYVSMNRVCRSCTITGTNMSTGTILKSSSTGEPTSHWTMSRRNNIRGVHNREIRTLFNIDQTTFPHVDEEAYRAVLQQDGNAMERGYSEADTRRMHIRFNDFLLKMRDNLVPVRYDGSGMPHYETDKDAVYMPRQKNFDHYKRLCAGNPAPDSKCHRTSAAACPRGNGDEKRYAAFRRCRQTGTAGRGNSIGNQDAGAGTAARLSDESLSLVEYWDRELKENPNMIDALESDVNNALEVIRKAERGEKIEYATLRNRKQTSDMQDQLPKHYFVADELRNVRTRTRKPSLWSGTTPRKRRMWFCRPVLRRKWTTRCRE